RHRRYEVPVAGVEVEDARSGAQENVDLLAEAREVRRVERRLDLDSPDPGVPGHAAPDHTTLHGRRRGREELVRVRCPRAPTSTIGSIAREEGRVGVPIIARET